MRLQILPIALSAVLLAACSAERAPADAGTVPPAADPPATGQTATGTPPATTPPPSLPEPGEASDVPPSSTPDGADNQAGFNQASFSGYGDVRFGTAAADMEKAWGGELREVGKGDNAGCYFMTPAWVTVPADLNFMIGDGKFVRFGTESAKFVAPGGGRIGMSQAEIEKLYAGRVEVQPHKYSDGKYLRIKDAGGSNAVLIFETDEKGMVDEFRVGVPPEVDYVEGCS